MSGVFFNSWPMFTLRKKKPFFTTEENNRIVAAISSSEKTTSGEIRVFVESKNAYVDPLDRAVEIFHQLQMHNTADRNGVLIYIAVKSREIAVYADRGIHQLLGSDYWKEAVNKMLVEFRENHICEGIVHCVSSIGKTLSEKFPNKGEEDKNELPDDIVFGK
jgi:uncharacterized membrane protein